VTRSRVLPAALAIAVALAAGVTGAGSATTPLVKNVNGWITALAMDGPQVAYATESYAPTNCFRSIGNLVFLPRNRPGARVRLTPSLLRTVDARLRPVRGR